MHLIDFFNLEAAQVWLPDDLVLCIWIAAIGICISLAAIGRI